MSERVRLFANGEEYRTWQWNNCVRCTKRPTCDLEEAMASACVLDGTVAPDVAARVGLPDGFQGKPAWCPEFASAAPVKPAAAEMREAGAAMLPGLEAAP